MRCYGRLVVPSYFRAATLYDTHRLSERFNETKKDSSRVREKGKMSHNSYRETASDVCSGNGADSSKSALNCLRSFLILLTRKGFLQKILLQKMSLG